MANKLYVTWQDIERVVDLLCIKIITEIPQIDSVHGLARGGLIPAVLLSHRLKLEYTNLVGKNTLVVDDICDTGHTFANAPGVYTAALHYKTTAIFTPTIYGEVVGEEWIVYPWENIDSETIPDYVLKML